MIPEHIKQLMQKLIDNGFEAYIIGGANRDHYLDVEPKDYDIFTNATGEQILNVFPRGHIIGGEERQAKILTVVVDGVEISSYRANGKRTETGLTLQQHLDTVDFSINAIAQDINGKIIDPHYGIADIARRRLTTVGNPNDRFNEDGLRIFRGIRFVVKYNLKIDNEEPFINFEQYVKDLPKERIREEFMKLLEIEGGMEMLDRYNMLEWIIPAWKDCKELDGGPHHKEPVGKHMFLSLAAARKLTNNPLILLAAFLHDIGKYLSKGLKEETSEITFYEHQLIGAQYMRDWMKMMIYKEDDIRYVTTIIRNHMMGKIGDLRPSKFAKICDELNISGVAPEDMLVITYSDHCANLALEPIKFNEFLKGNDFLKNYYELKYSRKGFNVNDLEIDGNAIIAVFGTGPIVGACKLALFDMVHDGKVLNRRDRLIEAMLELKQQDNLRLKNEQNIIKPK